MSPLAIVMVLLIVLALGWGGYGGSRVYGPDFNGGPAVGFGSVLLALLIVLVIMGRL